MKFKWPYTAFPNFYPKAHVLRKSFVSTFENPRTAEPRRFCFDPWYIEDQFYQLKTPAGAFFQPDEINPFFQYLVDWGRKNLGCQMISPPWLSLYLDGHFQNWHADNPQGPFAFVYSLTPQWKKHQGGKTLILKPDILTYWDQGFQRGYERDDVYSSVTPKWNQLLVFDPRIPHQVETVREVRNPLDGRLVLHGWFVEPRPQLEGGLKQQSVLEFFDEFVPESLDSIQGTQDLTGFICLRVKVSSQGKVASVDEVASTLITKYGEKKIANKWAHNFKKEIMDYKFKPARQASTLTLPLLFS